MKKKILLSFMLSVVYIFALGLINASAQSRVYGDLTYTISKDKIKITECKETATDVEIPNEIDGYPVTSIGDDAFYNCVNLKKLRIGENVAFLGSNSFGYCVALSYIECNANITGYYTNAFEKLGMNTDGVEVVFGDNVEYINGLFEGCSKLTSVTIGEKVKSIGSYAFRNCTGLTSVNLPNSVISIEYWAFNNCVNLKSITLGTNVESIGSHAFEYCRNLVSINLPSSVTSIGDKAFYGCSALTQVYWNAKKVDDFADTDCVFACAGDENSGLQVVFGDDVEHIPANIFDGCNKLININIPDSVTAIGEFAFYNCTGLKSITIGENVERIGEGAFWGCTQITNINWNAKNVADMSDNGISIFDDIGLNSTGTEVVFGNSVENIPAYLFENYEGSIRVTIGDNVKNIGSYAFYNCTGLTSVTIGDDVENIGNYAFYNCTGLTSVTITDLKVWCSLELSWFNNPLRYASNLYLNNEKIENLVIPDSVTQIGDSLFEGCASLTSVTISDSVTEIGESAFSNCKNLISVTGGKNVERIGSYAFSNCCSLEEIAISNKVSEIPYGCFLGCSNISVMTIPEACKIIGDNAFSECKELKTIYFNAVDLTEFGRYDYYHNYIGIFDDCPNIEKIILGENVKYIPDRIFENLLGVASVVIPSGVIEIGDSAFKGTVISEIEIPESVVKIGSSAFYGTKIREIRIPENVTYLGRGCFGKCSSLSIIYFDAINCEGEDFFTDGVTEPYSSSSLKTAVIGDKVQKIPDSMFDGCNALSNVVIGENVKKIGAAAFRFCGALKQVTLPDGLEKISAGAFIYSELNDIVVPDSVISIGDCAFYTNSLQSITLPFCGNTREDDGSALKDVLCYKYSQSDGYSGNYVTIYEYPVVKSITITADDIPEDAFKDFKTLTSITVDNAVSIGKCAFMNTGIKEINIPLGVTEIKERTFYGCNKLEKVALPKSITEIGALAFFECNNLVSISLPENITKISDSTFFGCSNLTQINIPEDVLYIGSAAFYGCTNLSDISFHENIEYVGGGALGNDLDDFSKPMWYSNQPDGMIYIGKVAYKYKGNMPRETAVSLKEGIVMISDYAFENSYNLVSVDIPETVETIGDYAFQNCNLSELILPETVETIGDYAFQNCNLSELILPESIKSIGNYAFELCNISKLVLPEGIETIGVCAFANCPIQDDLIIPDSVKSIGGCAFDLRTYYLYYDLQECQYGGYPGNPYYTEKTIFDGTIKNLVIGKNVKSIPERTFGSNETIENIYYSGSEAEWNNIEIGEYNTCLSNATIHYNAEEIKKPDYYGFCGDKISWYLDENDTLIIEGSGEMFNYEFYMGRNVTPWYDLREDIKNIVFKGEITHIGDEAFYQIANISEIIIPDSVLSIGDSVFKECTNLENVTLSENLNNIGANILLYTKYAENQNNWYGDGLYWGDYLLDVTSGVETFEFKDGTILIADTAFFGTTIKILEIPEYVKYLSDGAFYGNDIENVIFKGEVISFGASVFCNYTKEYSSLKNVVLPLNLTKVEEWTFQHCDKLESVTLGPYIKEFGSYAFNGCTSLKDIYFYGTEDDWTTIINNSYNLIDNECILNATVHYIENTRTTVSEDKKSFTITPINIENGKTVILALYDGERFVEMQSGIYEGQAIPFTTTKAYTEAKVMVWDELANLKPVCDVEIVK